ncbi:MAG TPA: hypothetical protein VFH51_05165, partial [Myxococcota bacterium]|nr:hypothetical protein [Myxococcota bacterium]
MHYLTNMPTGEEQRALLCARGYGDAFAAWYCNPTPPRVSGVVDVLRGLGMRDANDLTEGTLFAINGASNALGTRGTSSLNPTAVLYRLSVGKQVAVAYARGTDGLEVAAFDAGRDTLNFYLVQYELACAASSTCTRADRFLPSNERDWARVNVYSDWDLKNTVLDCLRCHEPDGHDWRTDKGTRRTLRMQEASNPWTHWFMGSRGSSVLLDAFRTAHRRPDGMMEEYAGIPSKRLQHRDLEDHDGNPLFMQDLLIAHLGYADAPGTVLYKGNDINADDPNFTGP